MIQLDVVRLHKVRELPSNKRLSPTSIVSCKRGQFFARQGYKPPVSPDLQKIFNAGNKIHKTIQKEMMTAGFLYYCEGEMFSYDPPIYGKVDGVIKTEPEGALEVKSTGKHPDAIQAPFKSHIDQATLNAGMLGLPYSLVYYESKLDSQALGQTPRRLGFIVPFDAQRYERLMERAYDMLWCIENGYVPQKECYRCDNPACFNWSLIHDKGWYDS